MTKPNLRPAEAANFLSISIPTLYRWCKQPGFPKKTKLTERVTVFKTDELLSWLEGKKC
ncbi:MULTISPECIES: helix-turn-helix transcriptional regulator [Enterobacteriaceae]|uniref:helix-turn-helix transcriptional regulator n=1 Tax=Enterobacteriaceae TaxID=543 RepID=UPI0015EAF3B6|nr:MULTISPECIES: helix-turn-helix domain-containing protein [unclassified Citrobacter]MBA7936407.1 AlpA family phage regulatory protein [Citrobacter sp. RHBSTW-00509]QLS92572.1 AlpA family phage regulatory protein [Citrobacter sp. RHBSTW-00859]QLT51963.1 AlpA family phage regulatory protein [Citrobacter sp. RHBSTW-00821]QLU28248.1 AlpA family phage regulatory protein [Citrobacter sp. RHBSTW-00446]QLZ76277.1 AlpA family phage regulatory protein [Citrobacter sp. RHBSTW-00107]